MHYNFGSFGMLISERSQTFGSKGYRFGFNGHERDDEVSGEGNSNTAEFWQYDSRLGRRWNIDPVEKFWESSYCSFANNPCWFIDPNGLDTVEIFKETGKINSHVSTDDGDDVFFLIDKDGNRLESISLNGGTIESVKSQSTSYEDNDGNVQVTTIDIYKLRGDDESTRLFEFLATNTKLEWTQYMTGIEGDKGLNFLTTTGLDRKEVGQKDLFEKQLHAGYTIRAHIHSHPYGDKPSKADVKNAKIIIDWYREAYKNRAVPKFKIYFIPENRYISYDENGKTSN